MYCRCASKRVTESPHEIAVAKFMNDSDIGCRYWSKMTTIFTNIKIVSVFLIFPQAKLGVENVGKRKFETATYLL